MNQSDTNQEQFPDEWLHDYVDGALNPEQVASLHEALEKDDVLKERLREITEIVQTLRDLPHEATPPASVWSGIRARTQVDSRSDLVSLEGHRRHKRRVQVSWPQLAAAAFVLVVGTGTATWAIANRTASSPISIADEEIFQQGLDPRDVLPVLDLGEAPAPGEALPLDSDGLFAQFEATAASLEAVVDEGEALLDPETVSIIRSSLSTMNLAIDQARTALEADPNSAALNRLLMNTMRKKVELLTEVATRIQAVA